jgi:hypothetical protein
VHRTTADVVFKVVEKLEELLAVGPGSLAATKSFLRVRHQKSMK